MSQDNNGKPEMMDGLDGLVKQVRHMEEVKANDIAVSFRTE